MNKLISAICLIALVIGLPFSADAKKSKKRPFYDSKSMIVNVAGDYEMLQTAGLGDKIHGVNLTYTTTDTYNDLKKEKNWKDLETELNNANAGYKMLMALTQNGTSDALLRQLALENAKQVDIEFGSNTLRADAGDDISNIIADDYLPVLTHNYIVLKRNRLKVHKDPKTDEKTIEKIPYCAFFRVDIDNEKAFDILANLGNPAKLAQIKLPVELVYVTSPALSSDDFRFVKELSENVPDFAIRGVLTQRNPAKINLGTQDGVKDNDVISIFSQRVDKDGNRYSKRISRAKIASVSDNESQLNFIANTRGNRKNGDIAVYTPENSIRFGFMGTWTPHVWGATFYMYSSGILGKSGTSFNLYAMELGFCMTDVPGEKFAITNYSHYYKSPMYWNITPFGFGFGKTFLGWLDFSGFIKFQYEGGFMISSDKNPNPTVGKMPSLYLNSLRFPIGVRFMFNIGYPTRFVIEAGYAPRIKIGKKTVRDVFKETENWIGAKRDGIFINAGFLF